MNNIQIIKEAYLILNKETPLKHDCGKLCNSLCCRDNGEGLGMWLLPDEKELLKKYNTYTFHESCDGTETVVCNGKCNRNMRPFACRIYPYYPSLKMSEDGYIDIQIKVDPRARLTCPIARYNSKYRANIFFLSNLKHSVRVLLKSPEITKELFEINDFLSEIEEMQNKFLNL